MNLIDAVLLGRNSFDDILADSPLLVFLLFLIIGGVLHYFAYHALAKGYTWSKGGRRVEGTTARNRAYHMSSACIMAYMIAFYHLAKLFGSLFGGLLWLIAAGALGVFAFLAFKAIDERPKKKSKGLSPKLKVYVLAGLAVVSLVFSVVRFSSYSSGPESHFRMAKRKMEKELADAQAQAARFHADRVRDKNRKSDNRESINPSSNDAASSRNDGATPANQSSENPGDPFGVAPNSGRSNSTDSMQIRSTDAGSDSPESNQSVSAPVASNPMIDKSGISIELSNNTVAINPSLDANPPLDANPAASRTANLNNDKATEGLTSESSSVTVEPTKTKPVRVAFPRFKYNPGRATQSDFLGFRLGGTEFDENAASGGLLVGLLVGESSQLNSEIMNIQPVYQVGSELVYGKVFGQTGGTERRLIAKPGYVLSGLKVSSGVSVNSIQLIFAKMDATSGRISKKEEYESDVVGKVLGSPNRIHADGWQVVGVFGKVKGALSGIGLKAIKARVDRTNSTAAATGMRTWTSSGGGHSFAATLDSIDGNVVVLISDEGRTVRVPKEKLSDVDQNWLKNQ